MSKKPHILDLANHAMVRQILKHIAGRRSLNWYDLEVQETACRWLALARQHLRVARQLNARPRDWRALVSRSYYAAYNVSRCVRYLVKGFVKFDAEDHKIVGDLPADFPNRASWSTFLVDLRKDRNAADYEPWIGMKSTLSQPPTVSFRRVEEFVNESRKYLKGKGIDL